MRKRFIAVLALLFLSAMGTGSLLAQAPSATPEDNPTGNTGALKAQIQTGGSYDAHSGNATRTVNDLHVPDALGVYGLDFTRYWNSVHNDYDDANAEWPMDFGMSGWSHTWHWHAEYEAHSEELNPREQGGEEIFLTSIMITFPDGHTTKYKIVRSSLPHGDPPNVHLADPRLGPDYTAAEITSGWPDGGLGVHDHLCDMAVDGSTFWLCRADGGSVHFVYDEHFGYLAIEVFDPHGLKTNLRYTNGYLTQVEQEEGGRLLNIAWGSVDGWWVITRVETGGSAGPQHVVYRYQKINVPVLAQVGYPNEPAPGQTAWAVYTYGTCFGTGTEPCSGAQQSSFPLLKRAADPHYAGPMTVIRYDYSGTACPTPPPSLPWQHPDYFPDQPYKIAAEKSDQGTLVSNWEFTCLSGLRKETNGIGGQRALYFGVSANTWESAAVSDGGPFRCRGYQLGKVTNFYLPPNPPGSVPNHRQNFSFGNPRHIWDGRNLMTNEVAVSGDDSGSPGEIHHPDLNVEFYNRVTPIGSDDPDTTRIHNLSNYWLFSKTDENSQTTVYKRDSRRRIKEIDYPGGSFESYTYNIFNQVETHTLPSGAIQHYDYDGSQHLWREWNETDGLGEAITYTYDALGRVATVRNPRAGSNPFSAKMEYNGRHQVTSVEYPPTPGGSAHPTVHYEYDPSGNCTAIIDELGHRKDYTYDSYRRCTSLTEQLDAPGWNGNGTVASRRWDWIYDRWIDGVGAFAASSHTSKEWRIQIEPAFNAAGERRMTARNHDVNNRITYEQTGWIQPPGEIGSWYQSQDIETHSFAYDENGQKSHYTDPLGRVTDYEYNTRNWLERTVEHPIPNDPTAPRVTANLYDAVGNKTQVTFPDLKTQQWEDYDAFGQPGQFIDERSNHTILYYRWGPMKKLAGVLSTGAGIANQWTASWQDGMGRLTETIFQDSSFERNTYEFGQPKTFWTRRGQTKTISYDARGREYSHTWAYGAAPGVTRVWDDANRLTSISNAFSTIDYGYDSAGQAKWEGNNIAGANGRTQITYCRYPSGDLSQVTYPNGLVVQRAYTARGQLQGTSWSGGRYVNYKYLSDGKVDFEDYDNGVRSDLDYNGRGFIILTKTYRPSSGQVFSKRDYWRDERDRITAWQKGSDGSANPMENGRGDRYEYDEEGQLTRASYQAVDPHGNANGALRVDRFYYDALGSRVDWNDVASRGAVNFSRSNNGLNQYSAWENGNPNHWGSGIFYDDSIPAPSPSPSPPWAWVAPGNGVTMQDGWITASFNALNQPVAMWSPAYPSGASAQFMWFGYDPLGRCVKRWIGPVGANAPGTNPATYFYYDGWNLVQEGPSASAVDRTYVHGNRVDEIVASQVSGVWYYHHYDARGHCIMLTNTSGGLQEQYDYDAFGYPRFYNAGGVKLVTQHTRFLFTGREWLGELRLYDYRARMYQPELGRFLQPDPKQFLAGDFNLYRYCHNDPINKSDPTGLTFVVQDDLKKTWNEVKKYLRQDPAQRKIIDRLDRPDIKVRIDLFKGKVSGAVFDPKLAVRWNPNSAIKSVGSGTRLSPAMVLGHELDHIYQGVLHPQTYANDRIKGDGQFENAEERRVITGSEASMLSTFFHEGPRSDYKIQPYEVSNPFER
jgi:RHS repeat-associated protein